MKINGRPFSGNGVLSVPPGGSCAPGDSILGLASYARTILVSPVGTPVQNGNALLAATGNYSGTAPVAGSGILIKLEPGVYDLGKQTLVMQPYVDLEGSGEGITIVTSQTVGGNYSDLKATLQAANNSEVRWITLENSSPNTADDRSGTAAALAQAVDTNARFTNVTFKSANGYGLLSDNSANPTIRNSTFEAFYGVRSGFASVTIKDSSILAVEGGLISGYAAPAISLDHVQIQVDCSNGGKATVRAQGISGVKVNLTIRYSTINVFGCSQGGGSGISAGYTFNGQVENTSVMVSSASGTPVEGIDIGPGASVTLQNSSVVVTGANSDAVSVSSGSITVQNSNLEANGGNGGTIYDSGGITIQNSKVRGDSKSLRTSGSGNSTFRVGSSQLDGSVSGIGTFKCVVTYKADFTQTNNVCQ